MILYNELFKNKKRKYSLYVSACALVIVYAGCKQSFNPPAIVDTRHYLVVEGFINTGEGPTTFTLTRTRNLSDTGAIHNVSGVPDSILVTGAVVLVEDDQGNATPLPEQEKGRYGGSQLVLNNGRKYRLYIKTKDGQEYASDYASVLHTPPIGDLSWFTVPGDGLHIEVNTAGTDADTKYYRWTYTETWEFHTEFQSKYRYDEDSLKLVKRTPGEMVDRCWQTDESHNILLATSDQMTQNKLSHIGITTVPYHDEKASVLYSILVSQMGISREEYEFWKQMKKNTEELGSLFDPQPADSRGNIHGITNPEEPVIGYVGAEEVKSRRIFIANNQLPSDWNPGWTNCSLYDLNPDSLWYFYGHHVYYPVDEEHGTFSPCADCTTRGTLEKPSFWP